MEDLKAHKSIYRFNESSKIKYWIWGLLLATVVVLLLPWTQNVRAKGSVTSLKQEQRPQELNSMIPGRIVKWFIKEGDFVKKGERILQITEVKEDYFDPELLERTEQQLAAKKMSIAYYKQKVDATENQIGAIETSRDLKQSQLANKITQLKIKLQSDAADLLAANNDLEIAAKQYKRQQTMYDSGLVSLTQLEQRNISLQNAQAKKINAENKVASTKQELEIADAENSAIKQDYLEKMNKAKSDQFQSMSQIAGSQGEMAK